MTKLGSEERVLWEGTRAWSDFLAAWIGTAFFFLLGVMLLFAPEARSFGLVWLLVTVVFPIGIWLMRISQRYIVTTERAIARRGLISRKVSEIELKHIRDIRLTQGIFQRIFGIGSLELSSAGRAGAEVVFQGIPEPEVVKELIRQQIRGSS